MIKSHRLNQIQLREPFASMRNELTARFPGDMVRHVDDPRSVGIIVACDDVDATVMWSIAPELRRMAEERMARQIQDEIDAEIIRDLMAINASRT